LESLFPPVRKVESEVNKSSQDSEKEWQCDWCPFFVLETVAKTELTDALRRISAQPVRSSEHYINTFIDKTDFEKEKRENELL
jgi:hypothetical protein